MNIKPTPTQADLPESISEDDSKYLSELKATSPGYFEWHTGTDIQYLIQLTASNGLGYDRLPHSVADLIGKYATEEERNMAEEENLEYHFAYMDIKVRWNKDALRSKLGWSPQDPKSDRSN